MQLAASGGASLTVDLREVDSVDAAAIGALLRAGRHCRARGVKLRVVYASGPVGRLLSLAAVSIPPVETPGENAPAAGGRELVAVAS
jgi:anti-anti-sigma factor